MLTEIDSGGLVFEQSTPALLGLDLFQVRGNALTLPPLAVLGTSYLTIAVGSTASDSLSEEETYLFFILRNSMYNISNTAQTVKSMMVVNTRD